MIRRTILFSGTVQGVGFRYAVLQCVGESAVTGYVRNLPGDDVEAVFEGQPAAIEAVLERVRQRMAGHIDAERTTDGPATGEFRGFTIRR
jgi:acylphosphatase